ncbi:MAG: methyltransferase domain-containing protein, partial [Spirochaetales bacterium]|nr:methyltransferase domain-containing protein [Spirochaetales bacterium]
HGTFHVNEILFIINGKQSNVSHHLKILQESEIVTNKKEGSLIYYRINDAWEYSSNLANVINTIQLEEKSIKNYHEDFKRLEAILQKRKMRAEEFFNTIGHNLDNVQAELFQHIYSTENIIKLFGKKLQILLDVGCGTGRNLPLLAKRANKVIGLDSSPLMLQLSEHICKKNKLNYELKLGDIQQLPFSSNSINGVFINMVLHHISDPFIAMKEVYRIVKPKGKILIIELLSHQNEEMREKYADLWLGFPQEELSNWLKKTNFTIKEKIIKKNTAQSIKNQSSYKVIIILAEKNSM